MATETPEIAPDVTTYADGFGNWHALVPESFGSRGVCTMAARRAILDQLAQRGPVDQTRVHITYVGTDRAGVHHFAERA